MAVILDSLKHGGSAAAAAIGDATVSDAEQIRRLRAGWRKGDPVPPELLRLLAYVLYPSRRICSDICLDVLLMFIDGLFILFSHWT
jgi:hypothetical protein